MTGSIGHEHVEGINDLHDNAWNEHNDPINGSIQPRNAENNDGQLDLASPHSDAPRDPGRVRSRLFETSLKGGRGVGRLDNPCKAWKPAEVKAVAHAVAHEYNRPDLNDLFHKAARNIRNPLDFDGFTDEEKAAIELEKTAKFWDQPWPFRITCLMLFMGAIVQGWSQTALNGANLSWPQQLGLSDGSKDTPCGPGKGHMWAFAAVNASTFLAAGLGCWTSDLFVTELFLGRRGAILFAAVCTLATSIAGAFVSTWSGLLATRLVQGWGMGCKATVIPVFTAEIAPARLRGTLVMNWQFFVTIGIVLGFAANLLATLAGDTAWRWQVASPAIPSFALLWGVIYVRWDSPRFLMKHERKNRERYEKRREEWMEVKDNRAQKIANNMANVAANEQHHQQQNQSAKSTNRLRDTFRSTPILEYRSETFETLLLLRGHPILAAKDLFLAHTQLLVEEQSLRPAASPQQYGTIRDQTMDVSINPGSNLWNRVKNLFKKSYIRREVYAALVIMISQQLCGVNAIVSYSSTLFCTAGYGGSDRTSLSPLYLSLGLGIISIICTVPAFWKIESWGRRYLALVTIPFLSLSMAGAAASSNISDTVSRKAVVALFALLFEAAYSPGLGPVPFTLSAEMFPLEERIVGMSLAVSVNLGGAGLLTLLVPQVSNQVTLLAIFAGLNVVAFILVWIYVREVIGRDEDGAASLSLEELFYIFKRPTSEHIRYHLTESVPYAWRKFMHIVFGKDEALEPDIFQDWRY